MGSPLSESVMYLVAIHAPCLTLSTHASRITLSNHASLITLSTRASHATDARAPRSSPLTPTTLYTTETGTGHHRFWYRPPEKVVPVTQKVVPVIGLCKAWDNDDDDDDGDDDVSCLCSTCCCAVRSVLRCLRVIQSSIRIQETSSCGSCMSHEAVALVRGSPHLSACLPAACPALVARCYSWMRHKTPPP